MRRHSSRATVNSRTDVCRFPRQLVSLAQRLRQQSRFADARAAAERALEIAPDHAEAWFNLGAALAGPEKVEAAEAAYRRALEYQPARTRRPGAIWEACSAQKGAIDEQMTAYRRAIDANPGLAPVWSNLGNALCSARRFAEADSGAVRATTRDHEEVSRAGSTSAERCMRKTPGRGERRCERALQLAPSLAEGWAGLANALMGLREFDAAIDAYGRAVSLCPQSADSHANLGIALGRVGREREGNASLRQALALDPAHDFASWNLAMSLLERGELAEGWARYEARWARPDSPARRFPLKGGPPFKGKALLWGEQGVGDHILYARWRPKQRRRVPASRWRPIPGWSSFSAARFRISRWPRRPIRRRPTPATSTTCCRSIPRPLLEAFARLVSGAPRLPSR